MQKNLFLLLLLCACIVTNVNAQVGVGTTTPNSTLDVRGSLAAGYRAFTAGTTASATDHLLVFTGTVAATLTLPDAVPCAGRMYWIKNATSSPLTIATSNAQTIDGQANWTIAAANKTMKLVSNGANWLVTAEMSSGSGGATAWTPGGNTFSSTQSLGTTSNTDVPFITNGTEKMRLLTNGRLGIGSSDPTAMLEVGNSTSDASAAIATRAATTVSTFNAATYDDFNGGVLKSTYPGGLTGQILNIAATGANAGNWPSNIAFWTRDNGGTNATEKMRLLENGRLEVGSSTTSAEVAIATRAATTPSNFTPATYANYNGSVFQSTYPGGLTGQILNIAATGANAGNWPSNIAFWTRDNGGTNATEKMRLLENGRLEIGSSTTSAEVAIATRAATTPSNFTPATYSNYNGSIIQSTYPGGLTGQNLNIAATGANSGNWPSNIVFFTRNNGGTNTSEKMRLSSGGRLEVGTNTATASAASGPAILTRSATSPATNFSAATYANYNGGVIQSTYPGGATGQILNIAATGANTGNWPSNIAFWTRINGGTNVVERMRISDDGFVGIGCTSPNYRLQVVGDIAASGGTIRAASAVISTSISACSDIRYKKNILPLNNALSNVMKLQGVTYKWKTDEYPDNYFTDKQQLGIIAQELEKIYPELVETDAKGYKTVDYSKMAPVLIEAIKEQQRQIAAQQAQIDAIKNDMDQIKKAIAAKK